MSEQEKTQDIVQKEQIDTPKKKRGFASMSPEKRSEIARKGGISAHKMGRAHKYNREEAAEAGRKGGAASSLKRRQKKQAANMETNAEQSGTVIERESDGN
jgi:uncharacterized protein